MAQRLSLQLLGDCRITFEKAPDETTVVDLPLSKARALLAYLALSHRAEPRSILVDLLWSDLDEAAARRNLRVVLTQLRQAVGDYLVTTRETLAFRRDLPYTSDVETFLAGAQQAQRSSSGALSPAAATALAQAFALYQGDFLRGVAVHQAPVFEEWMLLERERLRRLALQIGQQLTAYYQANRDDRAAIAICRRLLTIEPYHEENHRQLMHLLARTGQRTAALQQFERCRQLLAAELDVEPAAETSALYELIRTGRFEQNQPDLAPAALTQPAAPPSPAPRHNLPVYHTPFLGRTGELAQITALLLDPDCRLVTLVGPGGIGKTRLAGQAATLLTEQASPLFADGIFFVSAVAVTRWVEVIPLIAGTLDLTFAGQQPTETQLLHYLRPRRLLLLLDNIEHLVEEAATLTKWLAEAPHLRLLITSRERLQLSAEWLFPVQGLPIPPHTPADTTSELTEYAAVQLFAQRARRVNLAFDLTHEAATVAAICNLLQGMPLAIELAAGWLHSYSCAEILQEIQQNLDFLTGALRDLPARHQSLRALFAHSWRLLAPGDADLYKRLALLRGGFTAQTALAITPATRPALSRLVDKSLLQRTPGDRYRIHELLRQYAVQQVNAAEEAETLTAYCHHVTRQIAEWRTWCETAREGEALAAVEAELENLRVGWQWLARQMAAQHSLAAPAAPLLTLTARLSQMITYFFLRRSRYQEGDQWLTIIHQALPPIAWEDMASAGTTGQQMMEALLQLQMDQAEILFYQSQFSDVARLLHPLLPQARRLAAPLLQATLFAIQGKSYIRLGRYPEAEALLQESLACYQQANARKESTAAHNALGILYSNQGRFAEAERHYQHCLAIFREHNYLRGLANTANNLGSNFARNGEYTRALPYYESAYADALQVGEELMIAVALSNLGGIARALGQFAAAERYYNESIHRCRAIGELRWTVAGLNGLGLTHLTQGQQGAAQRCYREALLIAQEIQSQPDLLETLGGLGELAVRQNNTHQAIPLLHFVIHHPVTQRLTQKRCQQALAEVTATVDPTTVCALSQAAQEADLPTVITWALAIS